MFKYVTWNQFNLESMRKAAIKKWQLESNGWTLIHETVGCLTYQKQNKESYNG
jgi:hypothetical protein